MLSFFQNCTRIRAQEINYKLCFFCGRKMDFELALNVPAGPKWESQFNQ